MRRIDVDELRPWIEYRFDQASGPGGQNVNKVASRVTLLFDFQNCTILTDWERERVARRLETRLARDGRLRVVAQQGRTQAANRAHAEARLVELLQSAWHVAKKRRPTRPTRASQRRRVTEKRQRGEKKRQRRSLGDE